MPELKWSRNEIVSDTTVNTYNYYQGIAKLEGVYLSNYPTNEGTEIMHYDNFFEWQDGDIVIDKNKLNFKTIDLGSLDSKQLRPNEALFPSANRSPIASGYKYILYKYRIIQPIQIAQSIGGVVENTRYVFDDTDLFYYMAQEIPHSGDIDLQIKYERS